MIITTELYENGALVGTEEIEAPDPPEKTLNTRLEEKFLQIMPAHLGQPYCTQAVMSAIMTAKVAIIEANKIDPTGYFASAVLNTLSLPSEMDVDKQTLMDLI